jgi:hypothetical protein
MIRANCRARFTAADFDFIVRTLARSQTDQVSLVDLLSDVETRDSILDHPRLVDAILNHCGHLRFRLNFTFTCLLATSCNRAESGTESFAITLRRCWKHFRGERLQISEETHHLAEQYISDILIALNRATPEQAFLLRRTLVITRCSSAEFFTRTPNGAACVADRTSSFTSRSAGRTINLFPRTWWLAAAN